MDFKIILVSIFIASYLLQGKVADGVIGMNWGRQNAQRLLPSNVVDLMLQNGIRAARIFSTEEELLQAFSWSDIELTINLPFSINSFKTLSQSKIWVQNRRKYFGSSKVRQIYVQDYAHSMYFNKSLINDAMQAMQSLQEALNKERLGDQIKVTIPQNKAVLELNTTSLKPSDAEFLDIIKPEMTTFLDMLRQNNAPFCIAIGTIGDIQDFHSNRPDVDFDFAFLDNKSPLVIKDNDGAEYRNAFELMYDSYIWALKKMNASDLRVIVSQVGWPTDGYHGANTSMAERFYKSLLPFVSSKKGTPMRPGAPIDIYIQSLTDENKMSIFGNGGFTRHWGIYMSNGKPKYKIDLSGQGRDIYPATSKGIMRMPHRWCEYNGDRSNITLLRIQVDKACNLSDCTAMAEGGSCSRLSYKDNVTYAFNMYFQFKFQDEKTCDFEGFARVTTRDPSKGGCIFPVEVVKPEPRGATSVLQQPVAGIGFFVRPSNSAISLILLISIFVLEHQHY